MAYRTLGELRSIVQARIGMGAMGSSGANQTLLNSFLSNGQTQLYWLQDWKKLTDYADKTLGVGQNLIDYPVAGVMAPANGCSRNGRILHIDVPISGQYTQLDEGITTDHWSTMETQSWPSRFERYAQIMVYPKADSIYTVRVWYIQDLLRFTQDADVATLDDEMILLHAVANAKAHYRQPDAKIYSDQLNTLLGSLRGQSFKSDGVYRRDDTPAPERKPVVV